MRDVVITGMGIVSPFGIGLDLHWRKLIDRQSCIKEITTIDTEAIKTKFAGIIDNDLYYKNISKVELNNLDQYTQLSIIAIKLCLEHAGLLDSPKNNIGLILGTGFGTIQTTEKVYNNSFNLKKPVFPRTIVKAMNNAAASEAAIKYQLQGFNQTVFTACSSGTNAIGQAYRYIKDGYGDCMVAGGVDTSITSIMLKSWDKLRVLSTHNENPIKASRPFCKYRDGFALSEGAGFFVLESKDHALKRNAKIHAELAGYASNCDAKHITSPSYQQQVNAIYDAIQDAGLLVDDIDMINAHGTSTVLNDATESKSINSIFKRQLPVTALKSQFGHTIGASGAIETIISILMMQKDLLLPSINYTEKDSECNINLVLNKPLKKRINSFVKNSFGFGGNNAVLVVKKYS
tara:strand:- start:113 stop:1324 length:1212 start_codon:yes stop_codon:yes gene_type:complete